MSTETATRLTTLGAEFHHAAKETMEALRHIDEARKERILFLCKCSTDNGARLAAIKEELRTLPEQIAKWDAEAARLESQTAEDLLRQALEPVQEEKPEPYRAGLPPERLRKVWAEWEQIDGPIYEFQCSKYRWKQNPREQPWWDIGPEHTWSNRYRPHGATWARVEVMADEAEKKPEPTFLDLTKLPPGTVCEATADIIATRTTGAGVRFLVATPREDEQHMGYPVVVKIVTGLRFGQRMPFPALVPARVVKEGGQDAPR